MTLYEEFVTVFSDCIRSTSSRMFEEPLTYCEILKHNPILLQEEKVVNAISAIIKSENNKGIAVVLLILAYTEYGSVPESWKEEFGLEGEGSASDCLLALTQNYLNKKLNDIENEKTILKALENLSGNQTHQTETTRSKLREKIQKYNGKRLALLAHLPQLVIRSGKSED